MPCSTQHSIRRSILRSTAGVALAICVIAGPAQQPASAAAQASGWSSFTTDAKEPAPPAYVDWQEGWIAKGKSYQTPYYVYDSGRPGPTVAVVGGVHGDEPSGWQAAWAMRGLTVTRGRLLVIPEANRPAILAGRRQSSTGDLHRDFPRSKSDKADTSLARSIWQVLEEYEPDWLIDLHEGAGVRPRGAKEGKASKQAAVYFPNRAAKAMATKMAAAVAAQELPEAAAIQKKPLAGTLSRAVSIRFGATGIVVETSESEPLAVRSAQHLAAVTALLEQLDMS